MSTHPDPPLVEEDWPNMEYEVVCDGDEDYYWRVVARNQSGNRAKGPTWHFSTDQYLFDDRDGNIYKYVVIGDQKWMAENLAYLPEVHTPRCKPFAPLTAYYVYGYNGTDTDEAKKTENYRNFGVLYNYEAAMSSCPEGWHLPSDYEWMRLEGYLGISLLGQRDTGVRGEDGGAGSMLKSDSLWYGDGNGTNTTGFNALPAGWRIEVSSTCSCFSLNYLASFWTSSPDHYGRTLGSSSKGIKRRKYSDHGGFSVRCMKDK